MNDINVVVIGASGYTGVELIRLLLNHKYTEIKYLVANSNANNDISDIYSHLRHFDLPQLVKYQEVDFTNIDVVFCCLPHGTTQEVVSKLPEHVKIIDLSADFRLKDVSLYHQWYGKEHQATKLQDIAVYGLSEIFNDQIKNARIVACPGCYPTGASLALYPLLNKQLIEKDNIVIDAKSGTTGMGRGLKVAALFSEANENVKPYAVCSHRHMPEIEQTLSIASKSDILVNFVPQLVPMNRGILSTIYVKLGKHVKIDELRLELNKYYKSKIFVKVLEEGELPSTKDVCGTNNCIISINKARTDGLVVITTAIDNLTKGSSGQAIQNMNIMFGLKEDCGLKLVPIFP